MRKERDPEHYVAPKAETVVAAKKATQTPAHTSTQPVIKDGNANGIKSVFNPTGKSGLDILTALNANKIGSDKITLPSIKPKTTVQTSDNQPDTTTIKAKLPMLQNNAPTNAISKYLDPKSSPMKETPKPNVFTNIKNKIAEGEIASNKEGDLKQAKEKLTKTLTPENNPAKAVSYRNSKNLTDFNAMDAAIDKTTSNPIARIFKKANQNLGMLLDVPDKTKFLGRVLETGRSATTAGAYKSNGKSTGNVVTDFVADLLGSAVGYSNLGPSAALGTTEKAITGSIAKNTGKVAGQYATSKVANKAIEYGIAAGSTGTEFAGLNANQTAVQGGNIKEVAKSAAKGFVSGALWGAGGKALGEGINKAGSYVKKELPKVVLKQKGYVEVIPDTGYWVKYDKKVSPNSTEVGTVKPKIQSTFIEHSNYIDSNGEAIPKWKVKLSEGINSAKNKDEVTNIVEQYKNGLKDDPTPRLNAKNPMSSKVTIKDMGDFDVVNNQNGKVSLRDANGGIISMNEEDLNTLVSKGKYNAPIDPKEIQQVKNEQIKTQANNFLDIADKIDSIPQQDPIMDAIKKSVVQKYRNTAQQLNTTQNTGILDKKSANKNGDAITPNQENVQPNVNSEAMDSTSKTLIKGNTETPQPINANDNTLIPQTDTTSNEVKSTDTTEAIGNQGNAIIPTNQTNVQNASNEPVKTINSDKTNLILSGLNKDKQEITSGLKYGAANKHAPEDVIKFYVNEIAARNKIGLTEQETQNAVKAYLVNPMQNNIDQNANTEGIKVNADVSKMATPVENQQDLNNGISNSKEIKSLKTNKINVDPARFQFKSDTNSVNGTGKKLTGAEKFDKNKAGVITTWQDNSGKVFVVNGNHRVELANRTKADSMNAIVLKESDGISDKKAREIGAMQNIAEGNGSPKDAAQIFREGNYNLNDLKNNGLSPKDKFVEQGYNISQLNDRLYNHVVNTNLSYDKAAAIGKAFPKNIKGNDVNQNAAMDYIQQNNPSNKELDEAIYMIKGTATGGVTDIGDTEQTSIGGLGMSNVMGNNFADKMKLITGLKHTITSDKNVFNKVINKSKVLSNAGNTLNNAGNSDKKQVLDNVLKIIDLGKGKKGDTINDILNTYASKIGSEGMKLNSAIEKSTNDIISYLDNNSNIADKINNPIVDDSQTSIFGGGNYGEEGNVKQGSNQTSIATQGDQPKGTGGSTGTTERKETIEGITTKEIGKPTTTEATTKVRRKDDTKKVSNKALQKKEVERLITKLDNKKASYKLYRNEDGIIHIKGKFASGNPLSATIFADGKSVAGIMGKEGKHVTKVDNVKKVNKLAIKEKPGIPVPDEYKGHTSNLEFHQSGPNPELLRLNKKRTDKQVMAENADYFTYNNEEVEARTKASNGVPVQTSKNKIKEGITEFVSMSTRTFRNIEPNEKNAEFIKEMVLYSKIKKLAGDSTVRILNDTTYNLTKVTYSNFSKKLLLDDLEQEVKAAHVLPLGFTPELVEQNLKLINDPKYMTKAVKEAIEKRQKYWNTIKTDYIAAMKDLGIDVAEKYTRENYFRHQVLEYMEAKNVLGTGSKLKVNVNRGFSKERKGYSGDINTDYLQAEYEVMAQMISDTKVGEMISRIRKTYDVSDDLKAQAKELRVNAKADGKELKVKWEDIVPDDYSLWQPREGSIFFLANSVNSNVVENAINDLSDDITINKKDIKKIFAKGGKYRQYAIPTEIANKLEELYNTKDRTIVSTASEKLLNNWKHWVLTINPLTVVKYNLRNITGDLDAAMLEPGIIKYFGRATRELYAAMHSGKFTKDLKEWRDKGGFEDLTIPQEIAKIGELDHFKRFTNKKSLPNPFKSYTNTTSNVSNLRESILRYAAYLHFKEVYSKGKVTYGASKPELIKGLKTVEDKAYKASKDLLGSYDEISETGQIIRKHFIPFYSWMEVNFSRYLQTFKNATNKDIAAEQLEAKGKNTSKASVNAKVASNLAKASTRAIALSLIITLYNKLFHSEDEDKLPLSAKSTPHLILGNDKDGNVVYFNRLGSFSDFVDWFNLDNLPKDLSDIAKNRKTIGQQITDTIKKPIDKVISGLNPFFMVPVQLLMNKNMFPDALNPTTIRNPHQFLAQSLSLGTEYNRIAGIPMAGGFADDMQTAVIYKSDPNSAAYNNILNIKRTYEANQGGVSTSSYATTPKSNALYYYKSALKLNDTKLADKWLAKYIGFGGTEKGMKQSMAMLNPLYGYVPTDYESTHLEYKNVASKLIEKAAKYNDFVGSLDSKETDQLNTAMKYYQSLVDASNNRSLPMLK